MKFFKYKTKKEKRKLRVRKNLLKREDRFRLSVFRSNKFSYAQIIDDWNRKTIVSASEKDLKDDEKKLPKTERAHLVGKSLAVKALQEKITTVVFDRGSYKYHGRVKALAEGAREGGLKF